MNRTPGLLDSTDIWALKHTKEPITMKKEIHIRSCT